MKKSESKSPTRSSAKPVAEKSTASKSVSSNGARRNGGSKTEKYPVRTNPHGIPDYRLEVPNFRTTEEWVDGQFRYTVEGDFSAEPPPLRKSKYLNRDQ